MALTFVLANGQPITAPVKSFGGGGANKYAPLHTKLAATKGGAAFVVTENLGFSTTMQDGWDQDHLLARNKSKIAWRVKEYVKKYNKDKSPADHVDYACFVTDGQLYIGCVKNPALDTPADAVEAK
jgi:hypothetical protein